MRDVTLLLLVAGVLFVSIGAAMTHEDAWWLVMECVGALMVGAGWGLKP